MQLQFDCAWGEVTPNCNNCSSVQRLENIVVALDFEKQPAKTESGILQHPPQWIVPICMAAIAYHLLNSVALTTPLQLLQSLQHRCEGCIFCGNGKYCSNSASFESTSPLDTTTIATIMCVTKTVITYIYIERKIKQQCKETDGSFATVSTKSTLLLLVWLQMRWQFSLYFHLW